MSEELMNRAIQRLKNVQVDSWSFGENAEKNSNLTFGEVRSDYGELFREIGQNYLPGSVSALVVAGDGIFNSGTDPAFLAGSLSYPVYTVGIGDSTRQVDAAILYVTHNSKAFLDNLFPVEIDLSFAKLNGNSCKITIWTDNQPVFENTISVSGDRFFHQESLHLKADKIGVVNYRVEIDRFEAEKNTANNSYEFSVQVQEDKQKILLLANGPSPDIAAIKRALEPHKNYECTIVYGNSEQVSISDFDLIIAYEIPGENSANGPLQKVFENPRIPVLWVAGLQLSIPIFNQEQDAIQFEKQSGFEFSAIQPNADFSLFTLNENWSDELATWPALQVPFADVSLSGNWETLLYQKIQGMPTNRPLIALGRKQGRKLGLIAGEGFWRWRLNNMVQDGNTQNFDNLILKLTNYLVLKPQEDNFNLEYQNQYFEDQEISMTAELFNESFELVNSADVLLKISSEDQTNYEFVFDKNDRYYSINIGQLPVGKYVLEANTQLGDQTYSEKGSFRVEKVQLEQNNTQANFNLLYQIAHRSSGEFQPAANFDKILDSLNERIKAQSLQTEQLVYKELIRLKWLAIVLILLVGLEWFLRKFWGSY